MEPDPIPQKQPWNLRRLLPALMLIVLVLLAAQTCESEMSSATVSVTLGDHGISKISLELIDGDGEAVAAFARDLHGATSVDWDVQADAGDYSVGYRLEAGADQVATGDRKIQLASRARISIDLSAEAAELTVERAE